MIENITISIQRLPGNDDVPLPRYMTENAAGMDIHAAVTDAVIILPGQRVMIPTGIAIQLHEGYEAEIRPRSGLALRNGITLVNTPGTIDADYRGEIGVIIINHGTDPFVVQRGDRIAQMVVHQVCRVVWMMNRQLDITPRGNGGFGHTK